MRERALVFESFGVVASGHQQRGGGVSAHAELGHQLGCGGGNQPGKLDVETGDLFGQLLVAPSKLTQHLPGRLGHRVRLLAAPEPRGDADQLCGAQPAQLLAQHVWSSRDHRGQLVGCHRAVVYRTTPGQP
jgi:hypothetical protein